MNFAAGDTVDWNIFPLTSTYVSSTEMQAQVPASLIATPGSASVIVVIGTPAALNFGAGFTIQVPPLPGNSAFSVSPVNIQANDMVWDPTSQQIYLSIPSSNVANGNTITALNPLNGQLGTSVNAGSEPDRLALASDGSYLYAGIDGNNSVQRFTLPSLGRDISIPLGSYAAFEPYYAMDVEAAPSNPHTIAVVRGVTGISPSEEGGITIYDDTVPRPASVPGAITGTGPIDSITWNPDAANIYGIDTESSPSSDLYVLSVDPGGVRLANDYHQSLSGSYGTLHYDAVTGYLYSDNGQVVYPSTGALVGSFPTRAIQGGFSFNSLMVPDGKLNIAYFLGPTMDTVIPGEYVLEAFDLTHFTFLGAVAISNVVGRPVKLMRWGSNGLALLTGNGHYPSQAAGVYLISGGFVTSPAAQARGTTAATAMPVKQAARQ